MGEVAAGVLVAGGMLCVLSPAALVVIGVGGPIVVVGGVDVVLGCAGAAVGAAGLGGEVCRGVAAGGTAPE